MLAGSASKPWHRCEQRGLIPVQNLERLLRGICATACLLSAHRAVTDKDSRSAAGPLEVLGGGEKYEKSANHWGLFPSKSFGRMPIFFILETWQPGDALISPTGRSCPSRKSLAKNAVVGTAIVKSELSPVDRDTDEDEE